MVVKSNQLVKAKLPLSKLEHRIFVMLISQLDKSDEEFAVQKLYIKELRQEGRSTDHIYHKAKSICKSLLTTQIEVQKEIDGKRMYKGVNLMNSCEYMEGDGYIRAKLNEEMKPFLLELKRRFTMYHVKHFLPLDSKYSQRIYEMLKMREGISVLRITLEEFREILGVEDSYEYFSHLKAHVITKAQKEIGEKTDISFTYDMEKEGRSVKRIKFFIHADDEEPEDTTKIEDRTEVPDVDVMNLFLSDLTQDQIDNLDQETLDALHEKAVERARRENPDRSENVIQAESYRHMKALWENR